MSKIPIIGVIPLIDYGRKSYWMIPGYMNGLIEAGAFPIILPIIADTESERTHRSRSISDNTSHYSRY